MTPQEFVASHGGGKTDIASPRGSHQIKMHVFDHTALVSNLVHEGRHFYVSSEFRDAAKARTDGDEFIGSSMISKILFEGFAEHFAREVVRANPALNVAKKRD